ncbi:coiled-coil domain-containing protein 124-like [Homarus americanus]|uniref:coiled-coil domain-containing protein 124-like n=1 Tax=Homarus americanus TaxID=6706 RepID=UPI001C459AA4|nr:coiled-coil domain-containing protein 124-like [Homarus americanus]XP_042242184.1 coiled-coil domain-containing protein 124-like [Homarus americanus]XP_042242185.1 coiled-coil domain-containing protein 124-like [Homarus americanus]
MPKKFQGENSKAAIARARKADIAIQEKQKKDQIQEDALWEDNDKHIKKKTARKEDREKKRQAELERKALNRALAEIEEVEVNVPQPTPQKVTQFQLQKIKEKQTEQQSRKVATEDSQTHLDVPLVENLNRTDDEIVSASGVDAAIAALSVQDDSSDRHPEKRMVAAFKAFEAVRLPQIKKENPNSRLSQQKQQLRKEWQKSPDNPINKRQLNQ